MSKKPETIYNVFCDKPDCGKQIVSGGVRHVIIGEDQKVTTFNRDGLKVDIIVVPKGDYHDSCEIALHAENVRAARKPKGEAANADQGDDEEGSV